MADAASSQELVTQSTATGYPVRLTKLEARLLLGMLTNPAYRSLKDYAETVEPLREKLEAML